jgi:hypothetical protein
MIARIIDLAILLKLPEKYHLFPREKQFLIHTILLSNEGFPLEGGSMVKEICNKLSLKKADVYNYRRILKSKGWLMQTINGFELLPFLDFSKKQIPSTLKVNYILKLA